MHRFLLTGTILLLPVLIWAQSEALEVTNNEANPKAIAKLHKKHANWVGCFVVLMKGDTICGKIKGGVDYSTVVGTFRDNKIVLAHNDDEEIKIPLSLVKEFDLPGEEAEYNKYIIYTTPADEVQTNKTKIYRVILAGECMLVLDEIERPGQAGPGVTAERYFVLYKNVLTKLHTEDFINVNTGFKKKCAEIFNECPTLVHKIEDKTYGPQDLRKIVAEFNQCN
jgi:hypothetical protein